MYLTRTFDSHLRVKPVSDFPWVHDAWRRNLIPCLKPGKCLARSENNLGPGLWEDWDFSSCPPSPKYCGYQSCQACGILEISLILFGQFCLTGFFLTLSHCMIVFCWLSNFFPAHCIEGTIFLSKLSWCMARLLDPNFPDLCIFWSYGPPCQEPATEEQPAGPGPFSQYVLGFCHSTVAFLWGGEGLQFLFCSLELKVLKSDYY